MLPVSLEIIQATDSFKTQTCFRLKEVSVSLVLAPMGMGGNSWDCPEWRSDEAPSGEGTKLSWAAPPLGRQDSEALRDMSCACLLCSSLSSPAGHKHADCHP